MIKDDLGDFINKIIEFERLNKIEQEKKEKELQEHLASLRNTPKEKIVAREWYAIITHEKTRQGTGLQLYCDASGNITGYYEYQGVNDDGNYSLIFNVRGHFTTANSFVINLVSLYNKTSNIEESAQAQRTLNFDININSETKTDFVIYCKEYGGYYHEGNLDKQFFGH